MGLIDFIVYKMYKSELIRYVGRKKQVVLPSWIEDIGPHAFFNSRVVKVDINEVKDLHKYAFHNMRLIEEVKLNDLIKEIPQGCFEACFSLKKIELNDQIRKLGKNAFNRCGKLEHLKLPKNLKVIGDGALSDSALRSVVIPESVEKMGEAVFEYCDLLEDVSINCPLEEIPTRMFYKCEKLETLNLPENIKAINDFAFCDCESLKTFLIPSSVEFIGEEALSNTLIAYADLTNVKEIGDGAFKNCENLEDVDIGENIRYIPKEAFNYTGIGHLRLPENVVEIGESAFKDCEFLEKITFSNPDIDIHYTAFNGCINLTTINYKGIDINVSNIDLTYIDKEVLEYLYVHRDDLKKIRVPLSLNVITSLDKAGLLEDFLNNANFKYYKQIYEEFNKFFHAGIRDIEACDNFFLFCYTLGVFDREVGQKSGEILKEYAKRNYIRPNNITSLVFGMEYKKVNKDMIKEITDLKGEFIKELMKYSGEFPKLIGLSLSKYEEVQKYNTSDNAKHRRLRPTAQKFYDYFNVEKFENIESSEDEMLAKEIGKFYSLQYVYDKAKVVKSKFKISGVRKSLISEEKRLEEIKEEINSTVEDLDDALSKIHYEFLLKDDARNFTAGRYCNDCCGHIEGNGEDIAFGAILDENTQTLVLKDKDGEIVSKAVFCINSDKEIIINSLYFDDKFLEGNEGFFVSKYLETFEIFIEDYNKHHDDKIERVYLSVKSLLIEDFEYLGEKSPPVNVVDYGIYKMDRDAVYSGDCEKGVVCIIDKNITTKSRKR